MEIISTEELITHKILPYNIYSEFGEKLFSAGETLTPGKLLQLRHINVLYRDGGIEEKQALSNDVEDITQTDSEEAGIEIKNETESKSEINTTNFEVKQTLLLKKNFSMDDIDILNYRSPINKKSKINPQFQLKIKAFYEQLLELMDDRHPAEMVGMFYHIRDRIVRDILSESNEIFFLSQLKLLGEYGKCHALNTAILSGAIARKMNLAENIVYDVILAGLLHDIGKRKLSDDLFSKNNLTNKEQKIVECHTKIGYQIIKEEMQLPENIARAALEHHEHNDGSGYPFGRSGESINLESRIVSVCNYFENLTSNNTTYKIKNTKEALRILLEFGTKRFSAEALYTFIHMFSYNDTTNFEEMVL